MNLPPVGVRISLRHTDADGVHDLVGEVAGVSESPEPWLTLVPWDRPAVSLPLTSISAWRQVPPQTVRPSSSAADVSRIAAEGWPGTEQGRLGAWRLHAGLGWSSRANHTLPEGDPGMPLPDALERAVEFHRSRGIVPRFMLLDGSADADALAPLLAGSGWRDQDAARVMVCDLRSQPAPAPSRVSGLVAHWHAEPDDDWLRLLGRPHPGRVPVLTAAPAHCLSVVQHGHLVAIARMAASGDWIGVSCLHVDDQLRSQGIGAWMVGLCAERGRSLGARFGYLQVTQNNERAGALYERLGWREHHRYRYRQLDDPDAS